MSIYRVKQYGLEQGALEIQYIEEFFGEFHRKKTATEIIARLSGRDHLILMAEAPLPAEPSVMAPVAFKVAHELRKAESDPVLQDLVERLGESVPFGNQRILYSWIGGTRRDWRGQGHFRALTEQQEGWALERGFDQIVVKTKNKFYGMRSTLDRLGFDVIKFERYAAEDGESKLYLSKKISRDLVKTHRTRRAVVEADV
jgi:GNAT superfamily N-acetyltransferase